MRRFRFARRWSTVVHEPLRLPRMISTTAMPCEAIAIRLIVAES